MEARHVHRIESAADLSAAAILAVAVAAEALRLGQSPPVAALAAAVAFVCGWKILSAIEASTPTFTLVEFAPVPLPEVAEPDELLLTEADRVPASLQPKASAPENDALVLDDVLARLDDESRVVRLFDASAMPTPDQLRTRIERHLGSANPPSASPDASQELHEALAELRRTLR